jgi:hypothetical protein
MLVEKRLWDAAKVFCRKYNLRFGLNLSAALKNTHLAALNNLVIFPFAQYGNLLVTDPNSIIRIPAGKDGAAKECTVSQALQEYIKTSTSATGEIGIDAVNKAEEFIARVNNPSSDGAPFQYLKEEFSLLIKYSRQDRYLYQLLTEAVDLIKKNNLLGTLPLLEDKSDPVKNERSFQILVHEVIHFILKKVNSIEFIKSGMSPLDEGLCVFLHLHMDNKYNFTYKAAQDSTSVQYKKWVLYFEKLCSTIKKDKDIVKFITDYYVAHNNDANGVFFMIQEMRYLLGDDFNINAWQDLRKAPGAIGELDVSALEHEKSLIARLVKKEKIWVDKKGIPVL